MQTFLQAKINILTTTLVSNINTPMRGQKCSAVFWKLLVSVFTQNCKQPITIFTCYVGIKNPFSHITAECHIIGRIIVIFLAQWQCHCQILVVQHHQFISSVIAAAVTIRLCTNNTLATAFLWFILYWQAMLDITLPQGIIITHPTSPLPLLMFLISSTGHMPYYKIRIVSS